MGEGKPADGREPASFAERVLAERLGMIVAQTPQGVAGPAALGAIGAVVLWDRAAPWPLALTLAALVLVLGSWVVFFARFRASPPSPADAEPWRRALLVRTAAHGCCWGAYSLIGFHDDSVINQSVDVAFMYGLVAGAVVVDGPYFPAFMAFAWPTLGPVVVRCFVEGTAASVAIGSAGLVGLAHGSFAALNASRLTESSVRARLENLDLLAELARQKELAEAARRRAEAANQEKSRFLAAASHDLRQPVHALSLFAAAAEFAPSDAERRRVVGQMTKSVAALAQHFESLLEASRLDAGVLEPRPAVVRLGDVLERLAVEAAPLARERGLVLRTRFLELTVRTDPLLFERVVRNLLMNALAYTERGGVLLAVRRRGTDARVEVWDTGVGIPLAERERIFEPFYRIGGGDRAAERGVGLGLSSVRRLAELLGHEVSVASRPGRGSCFAVEVPLAAPGPVALRDETGDELDETALFGTVVVAIDDEPDVLAALELVLRQFGCRVVAVDSAERAEAELVRQALEPDVVLSDFRLRGGATGLGAIACLRKKYGDSLAAALVTGDTGAERLVEVAESGVVTLHKPVRAEVLRRTLVTALRRVGTP